MIYVRKDIPSIQLKKHNFIKNIEVLFIEINLRKCKILLAGIYHSKHPVYGTTDVEFFEQMGLALDVYSGYDKFILAGDFNVQVGESSLDDFMLEFGAKCLVKDFTCFKSITNPSCIDLFLTNTSNSFQCTKTVSTGLSDFHKMIVTVLKTTFPKVKPRLLLYRDYSNFVEIFFHDDLKLKLQMVTLGNYEMFENAYISALNKHAPCKEKLIRANQKPYVSKVLRKAIMRRSFLENKFYKNITEENAKAFRKQKNYCNRLYKRERKRFYSRLDLKKVTDNKTFWRTVNPLFSNKEGCNKNIVLVNDDKIISDDAEVAQLFNDFFKNSVNSLGIQENRYLIIDTMSLSDSVEEAIKKFEVHPSIRAINENRTVKQIFSFSKVNVEDMHSEIMNLDSKKAGTFMNIPTKYLKETADIICEPLTIIWNTEIIQSKRFPRKLKFADITPIFKQLESIFVKNYRPVSILPVVSKMFERIMQKQVNSFVDKFLSPYLCGYRKGYSSQYALLSMIEQWKMSLDNNGYAGGIMMDLSKAFDTINHQLLIAKLYAYGFSKDSLELIFNYLSDRWHRTKINTTFSSWSEVLCGVPQGSVLGPLLFNIYLNDLFYEFSHTNICNLADDTTPYACNIELHSLLESLEYDTMSAIVWFEANYMKLNPDKCHFLLAGNNTPEFLWAKVGDEVIWESNNEKLLGLTIDKQLNFEKHLLKLCKKVSGKVSALARLFKIIPFEKKRLLMKTFIESQFSYCPLIWMFCSRTINRKINHLHERGLRLVYEDYTTSFEDLLTKDGSVSIHHRNLQNVAIEMFKVKNKICPEFIQSLFTLIETKTRSNATFHRPNVNTVRKGELSLRYFGPIVWDTMLPQTLKEISDLNKFKQEIRAWAPENCVCRLCKEYVAGLGFVTLYE